MSKRTNEVDKPVELLTTKVYYKDQSRRIVCFCGKECSLSILPHLRKEHPDVWNRWRNEFVKLLNQGLNYRQIMYCFLSGNDQPLFTWRVIEQEVARLLDENPDMLQVTKKGSLSKLKPPDSSLESTTVWDFRTRGKWAVHDGRYRGNWPPEIPRNLILKFTEEDDLVLDPFVGGGTTLIESWLLRRRSIGIDIYPIAVKISREKIDQMAQQTDLCLTTLDPNYRPVVVEGDSKRLDVILQEQGIEGGSVDLVCAHPPYMNSLSYSRNKDDLSLLSDEEDFLAAIREVAEKIKWALKEKGICAVLIGDTRKHRMIVPLGFRLLQTFLKEGFQVRDIIIKIQRRDFSTEFYRKSPWFEHTIAHEYLFIFQK